MFCTFINYIDYVVTSVFLNSKVHLQCSPHHVG